MSSSKFFNIDEYRACTKSIEVEEPLDFVLYRPLAYLVVKFTYFLPLTPNLFSFFAFLGALFAGYSLIQGESHFFYGGVGVFIFSVFDCCDGMLARLKKNGSFYGEMIDMLVDLFSNICFFFGLSYGLAKSESYPSYYSYIVFISAFFILFHASIYRYYRMQYEFYLKGNPQGRHEHLQEFRDKLEEVEKKNGSFLEIFVLKLYLSFSAKQKKEEKIKVYPVESYIKKNKTLLPFWGLIAGTSHLFILSMALLFNVPGMYFTASIIVFNVILLVLWIKQKSVLKKLELAC